MILSGFMFFYRLAWACLLPLVLLYLRLRGRKDPLYCQNMAERFGFYDRPLPQNPIWVHAVSLGEFRSAVALIRAALAQGDRVLVTNFTPAGRREAERQFSAEIERGQLAVVWVPFDMNWCFRRLIAACAPRICLPLELEIWPAMIDATRKAGVPLYLCNTQYATKPMERDDRGLRIRRRIIGRCAGALVKSQVHQDRFASVGIQNITVTGELRFDQPVPQNLLAAAAALRPVLQASGRQIVTIASGVSDEEPLYMQMILDLRAHATSANRPAPLFVYVPRAPERFADVGDKLEASGLQVLYRSRAFETGAEALAVPPSGGLSDIDVMLGDSLGEMYFYLALADQVVVGGGFNERGAHNIIEPLAVAKPVLVGPHTWTIEFPFVEAEAEGVAQKFATADEMQQALVDGATATPAQMAAFMAQHRGASVRTLKAISEIPLP